MTGKAEVSILERLHSLLAEDMLNRLQGGECEAKDWAVIVKFLKDNGIDAMLDGKGDPTSAFDALVQEAQKRISSSPSFQ